MRKNVLNRIIKVEDLFSFTFKRSRYVLLLGIIFIMSTTKAVSSIRESVEKDDSYSFFYQNEITGKVTDENGAPLPGVNITIEGTDKGTTTNFDGEYKIDADKGQKLIFSSVGFEDQEIEVGSEYEINITMSEGSSLDEVIIVGYGEQKKANLTGAVSEVSADAFENRPIANLGEGLQGKVPNLQISPGNAPGEGSSFNIRGFTSINGGEPLILVDGVEQDPNLINPNDVESVSVLKDGASTAIYGSRAAYGVVLINTKSGKKDESPTINISSSYAVTDRTVKPRYVNSLDYINYLDEANNNAGNGAYFDDRIRKGVEAYFNDPHNNDPVLYDPDIDKDGKYEYVGNTDWANELYKRGSILQNNVSISGGSKSTSYYFSYGNSIQKGFLASYNDNYERHNVSMNIDSDFSDWLKISGNVRYTYSEEDHPSGGAGGNSGITATGGHLKNDLKPLMPIRHPDGEWAGQGSYTNPFAVGAEGGHDQTKKNDLRVMGRIEVNPLEDLSIKADYTFNPYSSNNEFTSRLFEEYHADGTTNIYPWTDPNLVMLANQNDYYHSFNLYGDYAKSFSDHNFKILVGYNQEYKKYKGFSAERKNLIDNDLPAINRATGEKTIDGSNTSWGLLGYFFRFNYDYKERYLLEINGRYDGSSKFPSGNRYVFSPSVSTGWRISKERFWDREKDLFRLINEFKIRGSFGAHANQNVGSNFPYIPSYGINTSLPYILGASSSLPVSVSPGGLVSPNFTWEKVKQWDVGVNFGLLDNKLILEFDYYNRYTLGMLTKGRPLPAVLGTGVPNENAADLKTKGWDFTVEWRERLGDDFSHRASLTFSNAEAYITKFNNPTKILSDYYPGYKIGQIWGLETDGLFQSQEEIDGWVDQSKIYGGTWRPGDVKYIDQDGDGEITNGDYTEDNHGDLKKIGNSEPRYHFGINYGVTWKNFDLDVFLQGVMKQDFVPDGRYYGISSQWDVPMSSTMDYWSEENPGGFLPKPYIDGGHGNRGGLNGTPDRYLQDASYLRLKQLSLSYTFQDQNWLDKARIEGLKIYFTGQNLFTWTNLSKLYDPENLDLMGYPVTKSYSIGLNITLK